jgi:membrane associated rhomboid family serine protease
MTSIALPPLTKTVKILLILMVGGFVLQNTIDRVFGGELFQWLALVPSSVVLKYQIWQLVTYLFVHADLSHLILNGLMLYFVGGELETLWGQKRFVQYFLFCGFFSAILYLLFQVFVSNSSGIHTPMVGASGSIYGLLIAYGILFGERVLLFMMLFPMKARYFIWVLAGVEFLSTFFGQRGGALSSLAHLGGMMGGLVFLRGWALMRVQQRKAKNATSQRPLYSVFGKKTKSSHLRLVVNKKADADDEPSDDDGSPRTWH